MRIIYLSALACLFLAACGEEKKPYKPPVPETPVSAPLFQTERQALDKAKGVEQTLDQRAQALEPKPREQ